MIIFFADDTGLSAWHSYERGWSHTAVCVAANRRSNLCSLCVRENITCCKFYMFCFFRNSGHVDLIIVAVVSV